MVNETGSPDSMTINPGIQELNPAELQVFGGAWVFGMQLTIGISASDDSQNRSQVMTPVTIRPGAWTTVKTQK